MIKSHSNRTPDTCISKIMGLLDTGHSFTIEEFIKEAGCPAKAVSGALLTLKREGLPIGSERLDGSNAFVYYNIDKRRITLNELSGMMGDDDCVRIKKYDRIKPRDSEAPTQIIKVAADKDCVKIVPIGDIHWGSNEVDEELFKKTLNIVRSMKNTYFILVGDIIECAQANSPGASSYRQRINPETQLMDVAKIFRPLADRIICYVEGNHEFRTYKNSGVRIASIFANMLRIPFYEATSYTWLDVEYPDGVVKSFRLFIGHGSSASLTPGGKLNAARKPLGYTTADVVITGHTHDLFSNTDVEHVWQREPLDVISKERHCVVCGSFLKFFGSYAEPRFLKPASKGCPVIEFYANGDIDIHKLRVR